MSILQKIKEGFRRVKDENTFREEIFSFSVNSPFIVSAYVDRVSAKIFYFQDLRDFVFSQICRFSSVFSNI